VNPRVARAHKLLKKARKSGGGKICCPGPCTVRKIRLNRCPKLVLRFSGLDPLAQPTNGGRRSEFPWFVTKSRHFSFSRK